VKLVHLSFSAAKSGMHAQKTARADVTLFGCYCHAYQIILQVYGGAVVTFCH